MVKKGYFCKGAIILSVIALAGTFVACSSSTSLNTEVENQQKAAITERVITAQSSVTASNEGSNADKGNESEEKAESSSTSNASSASKSTTVEKGSKSFGSAKKSDKEDTTTDKKSTTTSKSTKASSDKKPEAKASNSTWSLDQDCAVCHTVEGDSLENDKTAACIHVKETEATCGTCHTDEAALADVHDKAKATAKAPKKLKKTVIEAETCLSSDCHDLTTDELAELTAAITDCTDSKGTTVNPHEVMGLTPGHDNITCGNCHKMHAEEIDAATTCVSCHHAGVYECNTCH